jgi:hypothetical protein
VGVIGEMAGDDVPVLRRYAATQLWSIEKERRRQPRAAGTPCTAEILAEAITRAVTR